MSQDPFPLGRLELIRQSLLHDVVERAEKDFVGESVETTLREALFKEKNRIRKFRYLSASGPFTHVRHKRDRKIWSWVKSRLLLPSSQADRSEVLEEVLKHYAQEIGGHFDPNVYKFATTVVPMGFNWMLNAASLKTFLPWKMTAKVQSRILISGEQLALTKLAKEGTILLVPTHQSNIDSILIGYVIYLMGLPPFSYGAGLNLYTNPVLSFFMRNLGAYTVDRQKDNALYKSTLKHYSTRILEEGIHSIFFPGGGRARSGAIENHLKLGLLGTGLRAQILNYRRGNPKPSVFIVPMVTSTHFTLEASSLIEDYLLHSGGDRFLPSTETEPFFLFRMLKFFWKFFSTESEIHIRIGQPLDIFGNPVDQQGKSHGPNGAIIDPRAWLTTKGELVEEPVRDREYTHRLGDKIVDRFHKDHIVLSSNIVAYAYFDVLRKQYPEKDLYRLLRLSYDQRTVPEDRFNEEANALLTRLEEMEKNGELVLEPALRRLSRSQDWMGKGIQSLGPIHGSSVIKRENGAVWSEDLSLLYYYRNRLTGYGLNGTRLERDEQGFLA